MDLTSAGIGGAVSTGFFAVFEWILKRSITQLDKKLDGHDEAISEQSKALDAHTLYVAENYVNHSALEGE
jgi:hypothetical protein